MIAQIIKSEIEKILNYLISELEYLIKFLNLALIAKTTYLKQK